MRRSLALLALAACFAPTYTDTTRCGGGGECPAGRSCHEGVCRVGGGPDAPLGADAPLDADAPPAADAPPGADAPRGADAPVDEALYGVVVASEVRVYRGKPATVLPVTVARRSGFAGAVVLTLFGLPTGVLAAEATALAAPGDTTTALQISAMAGAPLGPLVVQLHATGGGGGMVVTPLILTVADPPGTVDVTWGAGVTLKPFGSQLSSPAGLAILPDGEVIAVMDAMVISGDRTVVYKVGANGNLVGAFGDQGELLIDGLHAIRADLQPDGQAVVMGYGEQAGTRFIRVDGVGVVDTGFGGTTQGTVVDSDAQDPLDLAVQSTGAIVYLQDDAGGAPEVCRLTPDGHLDTQFAGGLRCWKLHDALTLPWSSAWPTTAAGS